MLKFEDSETYDRLKSDVANEIIDVHCRFTEKQKGLSASDALMLRGGVTTLGLVWSCASMASPISVSRDSFLCYP
jgi:hypothetical protein